MDQSREEEIIRDVLLGDAQAFEALVRTYQGAVYGVMLRHTGNADVAKELAQEAFVRAYQKLETFQLGRRFFSWLYTLALNVARDWLRARSRDIHVYVGDPAVMATPEPVRDIPAERLDGHKAFAAIMDLEPLFREALLLRFRYDLTMPEIAESLDISLSAAKMRVSRGLALLRDHFKEDSDA